MSFIEAAITVLKRAKAPLTTREVTDRALKAGLLSTKGKTPDASMSAALYKEAHAQVPRVRKVSEPGRGRAVRGSVRWVISNS